MIIFSILTDLQSLMLAIKIVELIDPSGWSKGAEHIIAQIAGLYHKK